MVQELSADEQAQVYRWLEKYDIHVVRPAREFSDGTLMANLLKRLYPRIVDLNNYPSHFSVNLKLLNWKLLNTKVFSKLNLNLSNTIMENLANGKPGDIESVIHAIMQHQKKEREKRQLQRSTSITSLRFDGKNTDFMIINVQKKIDGKLIDMPQKMISYRIYQDEHRENKEKAQQIANLNMEIQSLKKKLKIILDDEHELRGQHC